MFIYQWPRFKSLPQAMARKASEEMACRDHGKAKNLLMSLGPFSHLCQIYINPDGSSPQRVKKRKKKSHENGLAKDLFYVSCWPVWIVPLACIYLIMGVIIFGEAAVLVLQPRKYLRLERPQQFSRNTH